ncbi:hypothetical protein Bbelb_099910 [Branchiostoma belcheri]|nr:hypothetical protein Bbelb_099910 [Branchiostoma belcheri]
MSRLKHRDIVGAVQHGRKGLGWGERTQRWERASPREGKQLVVREVERMEEEKRKRTTYCSYSSALQRLGLVPLSERRELLCRKFARTLLSSEYRDWLPPTRLQITGRVTRNCHKLSNPTTRTNRKKKKIYLTAVQQGHSTQYEYRTYHPVLNNPLPPGVRHVAVALSTYAKKCGEVKHTALPADQPPAVVHCTTVCRPRATEMEMGTTLRSA